MSLFYKTLKQHHYSLARRKESPRSDICSDISGTAHHNNDMKIKLFPGYPENGFREHNII